MSPEQLRGGERITAASDIYSMGVIAYEMVTGRRPFTPTSAPQLLELHRAGVRVKPIDLRNELSTQAQAIILRALSFDCEDRYQSAAEFGDSLARALLNEEETVPRPKVPQYFTKSENVSEDSGNEQKRQFGLGKFQLAIIGGFLLLLIAVLIVLWTIQKTSNRGPDRNANTETTSKTTNLIQGPLRSFIYSLTVRRVRDKQEFQSNDQDIFETGDEFRLTVSSSNPGYVYVFNEGTPEPNGSSFTILYPTPLMNDGSASVGADQKVQTNWNTFTGKAGTENLWIAWSTASVPELEFGKEEAFKHKGVLTGQSLDTVKAFLTKKQEESDPKINRGKDRGPTTVRGTGDVVVKMVKFQHR